MLRLCLLYSIKDHQEKTTDLCVEGTKHTSRACRCCQPSECCSHYRALALVTHIYTQAMIAAFQVSDKAALEKQIRSGRCTLGPKNH